HEASLSVVARAAHEPGLGPAGAVLALTGGALLPEPDGRWALRVPLYLARPAFLLARQGELALAGPGHAVARLRIAHEGPRAGPRRSPCPGRRGRGGRGWWPGAANAPPRCSCSGSRARGCTWTTSCGACSRAPSPRRRWRPCRVDGCS